ncbi:hypothetical protein VTJ49DRAFT_3551 [Mycothermus thermophilus]|uniref:Uncharacterized protein n=1 Tax=Humicola insolens TaxID=85995 RepID=A0ABR3V7E6_HUMIN
MLALGPSTTMHNYRSNNTRDLFPDPRILHGRAKKVPQGHFDPDELTRRLYIVLAEQQARAERKQKSSTRAEASRRRDAQSQPSAPRYRGGSGHPQARETATMTTRPRGSEHPAPDLITQLRRSESSKRKGPNSTTTTNATNDATATGQPEAYHHVPSQAAKQFTRTTTANNMRNGEHVHELSKRALKFHTEGGPGTAALASGGSGAHHHQQQHPHSPLRQQHTLEGELARLFPGLTKHGQQQGNHRHSTGAFLASPDSGSNKGNTNSAPVQLNHRHSLLCPSDACALSVAPLHQDPTTATSAQPLSPTYPPDDVASKFHPVDRARVDWSQSDEPASPSRTTHAGGPKKLLLMTPLLRKADSLLMLKGRRGSKDSESSSGPAGGSVAGKEKALSEGDAGETRTATSPTAAGGGKAGKGGFFARFKR